MVLGDVVCTTQPAVTLALCDGSNAATLAGYRVYRVTGDMVQDGRALALIEQVLRQEP